MKLRSIALVAVMATVIASCAGTTNDAAGPNEGVAVHGDWTIEIYNDDGSLDERLEFSNALTNGGVALAQLLAGREWSGGNGPFAATWELLFGEGTDPFGVPPCFNAISDSANPNFSSGCYAVDNPPDPAPAVEIVGANNDVVRLSGSAVATNDGVVNWVETIIFVLPGDGGTSDPVRTSFTGTDIPEQAVAEGQIVQVQLDISFSTG